VILVLSFPDNDHVTRVLKHLKREVTVVDLAAFPSEAVADVRITPHGSSFRIRLPGSDRIDLADVGVVWRRRLRPYRLDPALADGSARLFAWSETDEAVQGLLASMSCPWMNPPMADEVAQRKPRQLQLARELGLTVPETLITNDPAAAAEFIEVRPPGGVICKAFRNIAEAPRFTHRITASDVARLDGVRYAPVTFQEFIPAELDLRVTIVEDDIFAAAIRSAPRFEADYRPGLGSATVSAYTLPDHVTERLMAMMRAFELRYGAFDLRVTPAGEHVFLEVNPGGEYVFIADRTGQPIPEAIAAALDRHDRAL